MTPESTIKAAEDIKIMFELPVLGMSTVLTVVASAVSVLVTDVVPDVLSEPGSSRSMLKCVNVGLAVFKSLVGIKSHKHLIRRECIRLIAVVSAAPVEESTN